MVEAVKIMMEDLLLDATKQFQKLVVLRNHTLVEFQRPRIASAGIVDLQWQSAGQLALVPWTGRKSKINELAVIKDDEDVFYGFQRK